MVSAKQKTGLDELLEKILLQSEFLELKSNPDRAAEGVVVEAQMEKGLGETAFFSVRSTVWLSHPEGPPTLTGSTWQRPSS